MCPKPSKASLKLLKTVFFEIGCSAILSTTFTLSGGLKLNFRRPIAHRLHQVAEVCLGCRPLKTLRCGVSLRVLQLDMFFPG